jgi:hypothetical protein
MGDGGRPWLACRWEWLEETLMTVLLLTGALRLRMWPRTREGDRMRLLLACHVLLQLLLVLPDLLMTGQLGGSRCRRQILGMHMAIMLRIWLTFR